MADNYVFISYSRKNEEIVKKIVQEIEDAGNRKRNRKLDLLRSYAFT